MTSTIRRFGLGIGAATVAIIMAAGVYPTAQNTNGQGPAQGGSFGPGGGPGGRGRPGGPGGPPNGRGRGPMGRGGGVLGPLAFERLGLTEAQRSQVHAVVQSHDEELKGLNDRSFAAHQALEVAVMADPSDEGTIRARSADVATIDADMAVTRARIRAEVLQLLTPEQRVKAQEMPQAPGNRRPPPPQ